MCSGNLRLKRYVVLLVAMCFLMSLTAFAQGKKLKEGAEKASKASEVLKEIMGAPDKGIPGDTMAKAHCVAVFPNVIKAGFIVGGRGGKGVATCRLGSGWSAPAYFNIGGGSFGLQIGAQSTDFIFLFMNEKAMTSLLSNKFTMGGDASVAAGPVGRQAGAETDAAMNAQILSYSRSKGLFGGLELKGTVMSPDKDLNKEVYGSTVEAKDALKMGVDKAPADVQVFPQTVQGYAGTKEK